MRSQVLSTLSRPSCKLQAFGHHPAFGRARRTKYGSVGFGASDQVYPSDISISQELSGRAAVFRGDYKLVRNIQPYGDRRWHLYNLRNDPTESRDLVGGDLERVKEMTQAYEEYVKRNGVIEVPDGYDIAAQAMKNAHAKH
jgi:arylsulfatase/uncharacterized sulfatase